MEPTNEWVTLNADCDYEICTTFPHQIRKRDDQRIIKETDNGNGYIRVKINGLPYYKHRLIADQFLPNPDNLPQVDHINNIRSDNRIDNLRFVSASNNSKNRTSSKGIDYEYINDDDIPDDLIQVTDYGNHEFEDYYYSSSLDRFMFYNGVKTRLLHDNYNTYNDTFVCAIDKNNQRAHIYYRKFKKIYGFQ